MKPPPRKLPKPYYDDGKGRVIYHGDNRNIVPLLSKFDLLLTDPPYGIGEDGGKFRDRKGGGHRILEKLNWDSDTPSLESFMMMLSISSIHIIWGGNYFTDKLPVSRGWLFWDKLMGGDFSDGELAWTSIDMVLKKFTLCNKMKGKSHPTEKPIELISWCLTFAMNSKSVLDPWMGSGTTLRACKDRGLSCIGIDREEQYCEIAARRLQQEVLL